MANIAMVALTGAHDNGIGFDWCEAIGVEYLGGVLHSLAWHVWYDVLHDDKKVDDYLDSIGCSVETA